MYRRFRVFFAALALAVASLPAAAQTWAGRGRLHGEINDESGRPVAGAKITLRKGAERVDPATDGPDPVTTDSRGKWSILGLAGGAWAVQIEKEGFMLSEGQVKVNEYAVAPALNITLKAAPKASAASVELAAALAAIEQGNRLLLEEKYPEARAAYESALPRLEPAQHAPVLRGIARTHFQQNDSAAAIATLERALTVAPEDPETLKLLVTLLVAVGREQEADAYIARLPAGVKVEADTLLNMGIRYYNEGAIAQALANFERVVRENPELPDPYYYRGLAYLANSQTPEAKADFERYLALAPEGRFASDCGEFLKSL